eukprot:326372-Rhodomonas_salina.4
MQETAFLVQTVLKMRFLVFDYAAYPISSTDLGYGASSFRTGREGEGKGRERSRLHGQRERRRREGREEGGRESQEREKTLWHGLHSQVISAIGLRACYAMPGNDLAMPGTDLAVPVLHTRKSRALKSQLSACAVHEACAWVLRACYAVSGTDLRAPVVPDYARVNQRSAGGGGGGGGGGPWTVREEEEAEREAELLRGSRAELLGGREAEVVAEMRRRRAEVEHAIWNLVSLHGKIKAEKTAAWYSLYQESAGGRISSAASFRTARQCNALDERMAEMGHGTERGREGERGGEGERGSPTGSYGGVRVSLPMHTPMHTPMRTPMHTLHTPRSSMHTPAVHTMHTPMHTGGSVRESLERDEAGERAAAKSNAISHSPSTLFLFAAAAADAVYGGDAAVYGDRAFIQVRDDEIWGHFLTLTL